MLSYSEKFIFLSAIPYDFHDEKTNRDVVGCSVMLQPIEPNNADRGGVGAQPQKYSVPKGEYDSIYNRLDYLKTYTFEFEVEIRGNRSKTMLKGIAQK